MKLKTFFFCSLHFLGHQFLNYELINKNKKNDNIKNYLFLDPVSVIFKKTNFKINFHLFTEFVQENKHFIIIGTWLINCIK